MSIASFLPEALRIDIMTMTADFRAFIFLAIIVLGLPFDATGISFATWGATLVSSAESES